MFLKVKPLLKFRRYLTVSCCNDLDYLNTDLQCAWSFEIVAITSYENLRPSEDCCIPNQINLQSKLSISNQTMSKLFPTMLRDSLEEQNDDRLSFAAAICFVIVITSWFTKLLWTEWTVTEVGLQSPGQVATYLLKVELHTSTFFMLNVKLESCEMWITILNLR